MARLTGYFKKLLISIRPEYCATEFILKKLPKGRLNAISDVESILNKWTGDNEWAQYYEIYLRWA